MYLLNDKNRTLVGDILLEFVPHFGPLWTMARTNCIGSMRRNSNPAFAQSVEVLIPFFFILFIHTWRFFFSIRSPNVFQDLENLNWTLIERKPTTRLARYSSFVGCCAEAYTPMTVLNNMFGTSYSERNLARRKIALIWCSWISNCRLFSKPGDVCYSGYFVPFSNQIFKKRYFLIGSTADGWRTRVGLQGRDEQT